MQYCIVKLNFKTPVRFGIKSLDDTSIICHSDTLFSAIFIEAMKIYGADKAELIKDKLQSGDIKISSMMPYFYDSDEEESWLYVPKPIISLESVKNTQENTVSLKKKVKKLKFLRISYLEEYINALKNQDVEMISSYINYVALEKTSQNVNLQQEKNQIYSITSNVFQNRLLEDNENIKSNSGIVGKSGLYFVMAYNDDGILKILKTVLNSLQYTGIGGKKSIGYGKFDFEITNEGEKLSYDEEELLGRIKNIENYDKKMLISLLSPSVKEIEELDIDKISYSLLKRGGFVDSFTYSENLVKKKYVFMFEEGSVMNKNINGEIKDLKRYGNHSIYRNGIAMYVGVEC